MILWSLCLLNGLILFAKTNHLIYTLLKRKEQLLEFMMCLQVDIRGKQF